MNDKFPLELPVAYALHLDFRQKVESIPGATIAKVVELKTCELLLYWVHCDYEHTELIINLAFHTFIRNPNFQKYYGDCPAFKPIAEVYVKSNCSEIPND